LIETGGGRTEEEAADVEQKVITPHKDVGNECELHGAPKFQNILPASFNFVEVQSRGGHQQHDAK